MTATILQFEPRSATIDGGKARIQARRQIVGLSPVDMCRPNLNDLTMDHADPCDIPSDSAYPSPQG
jgi:hypothetical protein